jgi:hypothetical protein
MRRRTLLTGAAAGALISFTGAPSVAAEAAGPRLERFGLAPTMPAVPLTIAQATTHVAAAARAHREARYSAVAAALPDLLARLHTTAENTTGRDRDTAAALLSRTYQVASSVATKEGDDATAFTMADRARTQAVRSGDHLTITAATHILAITLRRDGNHTAALDLLTGTAQQLELRQPDSAVLAAYGSLLCTAGYTSAQAGNASAADTYLREAAAAASRITGVQRPSGVVPFSPATVAIYRISVHTTLGDTGAALEHAASVNPALLPTRERYGRYLIDTARAWARHGRADNAADAVLTADRSAPEEVNRPSGRELVRTLLGSPTPTPAALRDLAGRIGIR